MENKEKNVTIGAYIYPKGGTRENRIHVLFTVTETQAKRIDEIVKQKGEAGAEYSLSTIISAVKEGEM